MTGFVKTRSSIPCVVLELDESRAPRLLARGRVLKNKTYNKRVVHITRPRDI